MLLQLATIAPVPLRATARPRGAGPALILALLVAFGPSAAFSASAQDVPDEEDGESRPADTEAGEVGTDSEDPCDLDAEGNFIDWLNSAVAESVCSSARWFDSFFGTAREFDDSYATFGRLGLGAYWDEDDGIDPELRFRGKINLPNMNRRWNAVLGRGPVDGVSDADPTSSPAEQFFDDDEEWLLGFGFTARRSTRANLSLNVGASFSRGIDPYASLRYIYQAPFTERSQFRLRVAPQWQDSKGVGYTFRPGIDHALNDDMLLRWGAFVKDFRKRFDGVSYGTFIVLFHQIGPRDALRYRVGLISESGLEHQPQDALATLSWRTMVYKEILIIESQVGTTFRRRPGESDREPELILGLVAEIRFGE